MTGEEAEALDRRICSAIAEVILEAETNLEHHLRFGTWVGRSRYGLGVAMVDRITVIEPATGKHLRSIPSPTLEDAAYLGLLSR
jgi:hypothetical protein